MTNTKKTEPVAWWLAEHSDAHEFLGPYPSRDAALAEAESGWLVFQARPVDPDIRLADHLVNDVDLLLDNANDSAGGDMLSSPDGDVLFEIDDEQGLSLIGAIRAAVNAWQDANGLVWKSWHVEVIGEKEVVP